MPSTKPLNLAVAFCAAVMLSNSAFAFEEKPYTEGAFKAAQQAGKPILVDAYASWCPVCRAQQNVLEGLKQDAKYDALTVFKIDYDHQPDALRTFNGRQQSTLIAFKGDKETARSVGDTSAAAIASLLATTLQ